MDYNQALLQVYRGLSNLAGLVGWPWFYWHLKSRGRGESFRPRLGLQLPAGPPPGYPRIWLHGASVGEIQAAVPLARELKKLLPLAGLIVTTGTETGQALARKHFTPLGAVVCYFPLDIPWAVRRYLERLRPHLAVTLESEIWPNFLELAHQRRILLVLTNARISDHTFRRYLRYRWYFNNIISNYDLVTAGTSLDYQRLRELGLDLDRLHLTGNLKCDRRLKARDEAQAREFQRLLQGADAASVAAAPVWLAASSHAGEEEVVLAAYEQLRAPYPALLLVLAPRHPERASALGELLTSRGLPFHLWSALKAGQESRRHPVVLVDTIGDLFSLYGAVDLAFVGGSLIPHGGQNLLEPAAWGLSPLYGPHLENFRWAQAILEEAGAGLEVSDAASLAAAAANLLQDPERRRELGSKAQAALTPHQGAARRQAELIAELWHKQGGSK
ncbi:MAG: 3-deoxy-D-manno-octulosonic acid transferase [Deltaproteobacteria bacterium]|nr:3-deoxy-D-manno-octulosonic acid transferase [Deltaproteobacteria bacterium]